MAGMGEGFAGEVIEAIEREPKFEISFGAVKPKDVAPLVRLYMECNGMEGMKNAVACNRETIKENEELKREVASLKRQVAFRERIINKLTEVSEDY